LIFAAFLLLAAFFVVYVLLPFWEQQFRHQRVQTGPSTEENLRSKKDEILEAMRDLEYDYKMNKVTSEDYDDLKERFTKEAIEIMKQLDKPKSGVQNSKKQLL
jgi:hypothetical protein